MHLILLQSSVRCVFATSLCICAQTMYCDLSNWRVGFWLVIVERGCCSHGKPSADVLRGGNYEDQENKI